MMIPPTQSSQLITVLERLGPQDHPCSIYESHKERLAVVIRFIRIGLERQYDRSVFRRSLFLTSSARIRLWFTAASPQKIRTIYQ